MRPRKLLALLLVLAGLLLLGATAFLIVHNLREDRAAAQSSQQALARLEATRPTQTEPAPTSATTPPASAPTLATVPTDPTDPPTLSSELLDGHEYVGFLTFPSLNRKLPVMKIAYLEDLQIAPCLEQGSPLTDDAVISAHNYPSHFGPIRYFTGGESVVFTTLDGQEIHYTVTQVETIDPQDVDKVMNSPHALALYTCTPGGAKRVLVACDRTE